MRVDTAGAFHRAVDSGTRDVEQGGELSGGVLASPVQLDEVLLLSRSQLALLTAQPPVRPIVVTEEERQEWLADDVGAKPVSR